MIIEWQEDEGAEHYFIIQCLKADGIWDTLGEARGYGDVTWSDLEFPTEAQAQEIVGLIRRGKNPSDNLVKANAKLRILKVNITCDVIEVENA